MKCAEPDGRTVLMAAEILFGSFVSVTSTFGPSPAIVIREIEFSTFAVRFILKSIVAVSDWASRREGAMSPLRMYSESSSLHLVVRAGKNKDAYMITVASRTIKCRVDLLEFSRRKAK